jgi:hypothetical protein
MLPIVMQHRVVQGIDALEIFGIEHVLRTDSARGGRAEIGFEQLHHRADDREARDIDLPALDLELQDQIFLQQCEQYDAWRFLDLVQHPVELLLAAHQGIDMLHRGHIGVLRGDCARHGDQGFAGRIGN